MVNLIILTIYFQQLSQFQFKIWKKGERLSLKIKNIMLRLGIPHSFFEGDTLMF